MVDWVLVTEKSHPCIFAAFEIISHDNGAGSGHTNYSVYPSWAPHLNTIEKALAGLGDRGNIDGDFVNFCIGEQEKMEAIAKRSPELALASCMFNSFFEGWDKGPDSEDA
jgi:hypothetical protein